MSEDNKGKVWTLKDEYLLLELVLTGRSITSISRVLGRSPKACSARVHKLLPKSGNDKGTLIEYLTKIPPCIYDYHFTVYIKRKRLSERISSNK
jgi:hypothetical protein